MISADVLTRDNLDAILKEFARNYRRFCGKMPAEFIIVGGGSIVLNYGFRETTQGLDVLLRGPSGIRDAVIATADKLDLPEDWLNSDFRFLPSYSDKLYRVAEHYRSLNHGQLEFRTVKAEYLIAMKMVSGREFSNDIPDIIGIVAAEKTNGHDISWNSVREAGEYLYPGFNEKISESLKRRVENWCAMEPEILDNEYEDAVEISSEINRIILGNSEDILLSKKEARYMGIRIEGEFNQEPGIISASSKDLLRLISNEEDTISIDKDRGNAEEAENADCDDDWDDPIE